MKKWVIATQFICINFFLVYKTGLTQSCGTIYGAGFSGSGSSIGVRQFSTGTNTWNGSSLVNTSIFTGSNTINNGGPVAIDPLNQNINMITDASEPYAAALFSFSSVSPTIVNFPSSLNFITQRPLCSAYRNASHICYYMTANFLSTATSDPGASFFSIDFTNPASPTAKVYASSLSAGSPFINAGGGGDFCFDLNGTGYLVTSSKQLYRIVTDETALTATFTYIASLSSLNFAPTGTTFDPANNKLIITGVTKKVAEYDLSNNTVITITNASGFIAPDLTGCFFPNINAALKTSLQLFDITQGTATPSNIGVGDILTFTVTIYNTGNVNAGNFSIQNPLPVGISYVANSTKMNGASVADAPAAGNFPFNAGREAHSGNQASNSGVLATNITTGFDSTVITYNVVVTGSLGQKITNAATGNVAGSLPSQPMASTASSAFKIGGGVALPVTLINFKGSYADGIVKLDWETASESGNSGFIVQRGLDGTNFEDVGSIPSSDPNSSSILQYTFSDKSLPFAPQLYYRLKQVDIDGKYEFSPVLILKIPDENSKPVVVTPNPFHDRMGINVASSINISAKLLISDLNGAVLINRNLSLIRGNNIFTFDETAQLPKGIYLLQVISPSKVQTVKIIKD